MSGSLGGPLPIRPFGFGEKNMANIPPGKPTGHDPYSSPVSAPGPPIHQVDPASRLGAPGAGLIIAGIFSAISSLCVLGWAIFMMFAVMSISGVAENINEVDQEQQLSEEEMEAITEMSQTVSTFGAGMGILFITISALLLVSSCLVIYGGIQMTRARSHTLCLVAAFLAMLPTGCWLLSLPIGIWALIVLLDGNVKARFT